MLRSINAVIHEDGQVVLNKKIKLKQSYRAIVTILEESSVDEITLLSESVLATDWARAEEDEAWSHLQ